MLRALLPLALFALQAPTIAIAPVEGAKTSHSVSFKMNTNGAEVTVDMGVTTTITKVTDDSVEAEQAFEGLNVVANGTPMAITADPSKVVYGKDGSLKSRSGGVQGTDSPTIYLIFRFVPTPAETGKTTTVEFKGSNGIPDQKVESTYIGPKKVDEGDGFEFKQKTTAEGLTATTDFVVKADCTILEATSTFTGLPIPAAGGTADGTGTMKLKP